MIATGGTYRTIARQYRLSDSLAFSPTSLWRHVHRCEPALSQRPLDPVTAGRLVRQLGENDVARQCLPVFQKSLQVVKEFKKTSRQLAAAVKKREKPRPGEEEE
ncbi:MAG: hypothetical protein ACRD1O_00880 [Terriglobia bacterium]